jgi:hypothetical protein
LEVVVSCEKVGFRHGAIETFALVECCAALVDTFFLQTTYQRWATSQKREGAMISFLEALSEGEAVDHDLLQSDWQ